MGLFTVMEHRPVIKRGWDIPEVNGGLQHNFSLPCLITGGSSAIRLE